MLEIPELTMTFTEDIHQTNQPNRFGKDVCVKDLILLNCLKLNSISYRNCLYAHFLEKAKNEYL